VRAKLEWNPPKIRNRIQLAKCRPKIRPFEQSIEDTNISE